MLRKLVKPLAQGNLAAFGLEVSWSIRRTRRVACDTAGRFATPYRLHLGPGAAWTKPDNHWIDVDIDPSRGDLVMDFQDFDGFPLPDGSVDAIYGSHVFEHMSIWVTDRVFAECCRVLEKGGVLRVVLPDVEKSIREYVAGNREFPLFARRRQRAKKVHGKPFTLFECLKEDFLSKSLQPALLGQRALAHQNAWDFETLEQDLLKAGFSAVSRSGFQQSSCPPFAFEGTYASEANQHDRSLYVEAIK